jgi:hypothetical protein
MERQPRDEPTPASALPELPGPEALLDALREHPEWDEDRRDEVLERLIADYPAERLAAALRGRLVDLSGLDGEPVLRLVEAVGTPDLLDALAQALVVQPGLAPERAWDALALLEDAGLLERYPVLAERREELDEALDEEGSLTQLATQIEDEPEGIWLALQGLGAIEPPVRVQIIAGLVQTQAGGRLGPNLVEFLRLLSFAHDPDTRAAARAALGDIPLDHDRTGLAVARTPVKSLVTAIDGQGRGTIVLTAIAGNGAGIGTGTTRTSAAFLCDVERGIRDVYGQVDVGPASAGSFLDAFAEEAECACVRDMPALAVGLLRGCLVLCGPETSPALRYWLEATLGPDITPQPFPIPFPDWDPASVVPEEMAGRAGRVLEACPSWIDTSELTRELAREILLREGDSPPDPRRDAGVYRYLFEHHLRGRLELYRRMLLWMASFWQAAGAGELGRSALALASQLSDEQHAVAGHPFTVALTTRSLTSAQASLRAGREPRPGRILPGA